jgi:signal transduction histidine kinase
MELTDAAELERRRLERELRTGVERPLDALARDLSALSHRVEQGSDEAELVHAAREKLDSTRRQLRDLGHMLHLAALERYGLRMTLEGLAVRSAIPVSIAVDLPHRPPRELELLTFYLVADVLSSAEERGDATEARVVVTSRAGHLSVEVTHDGTAVTQPIGLADRIALVGGSLRVSTAPAAVTASIPMAELAAAA